jgi:membrane dipeptidase
MSGACALAAPLINRGRFRLFAQSEREYCALTIDLVRSSLVIDMLGLLTLDYRKLTDWQSRPDRFQAADLRRLKTSGITVFHPAAGFVGGDIYQASLGNVMNWNAFIAAHSDDFLRVDSIADLRRAKNANKIGVIIGLQNSEHFRTETDVDRFYSLGQRVSQLTYDRNRLGGGSSNPVDAGLTDFGARVVERMNGVGMAIDVSHCADRTTLDAIGTSSKPVLVTHSNCRSLVPGNARCKADSAIRKMAEKGGVMGVTMVRPFVSQENSATIEGVLKHIDHIAKLVGVEHVGLGTDVDLDGRDRHPAPTRYDLDGIQYEKKVFAIVEGLVSRKYSSDSIRLILGGNFQRALGEIFNQTITTSRSIPLGVRTRPSSETEAGLTPQRTPGPHSSLH